MKKLFMAIAFLSLIACQSEQAGNNNTSQKSSNPAEEERIEALLSKMSLEEKIGQTALRGSSSSSKGGLSEELINDIKAGRVGAFLNVMDPLFMEEIQRLAVEEGPNGIPVIFARDVIHGFKTIFPIPLGLAASWEAEQAEICGRVSSIEATQAGIRWTFAPMVDVCRDSRWGRISESPGEDPYLGELISAAYVRGFQGDSLNAPDAMAACVKHFAAYGAAIGGRDYNSVELHESQLRNVILPPFKAAFDAGVATVMTSFNDINGVPASGNSFLLKDVLKDEIGFDGFVVSDWNSITEMIPHGYAADEKHAADLAANAGLDMEMTSESYENHLEELIAEGKFSEAALDDFVRNILRIKIRLGLFENPYTDRSNPPAYYKDEHMEAAKTAAVRSSVLLKNNKSLLPLNANTKVALIGPLADKGHEQLGTWTFDGEKSKTQTVLDAFEASEADFKFVEGLTHSRDKSSAQFKEAVRAAKKADVAVIIAGEEAILSGEAHSRAKINLPGAQEALIHEIEATGTPVVLVIMAGRPITFYDYEDELDAVLMTWHPGTMGGPAIYDMLYGISEPEGRLPVTWPKTAGQLPLYYNHKNTGRPASAESFVPMDEIPVEAWQSSLGNTSHYLDYGFTPHYPFGYGLGYTTYEYSNLVIAEEKVNKDGTVKVTVDLTNTGSKAGHEIAQLYVQDVTASTTRPVRELKAYQKVELKSGETKTLSFELPVSKLSFVGADLETHLEAGTFNLWIGNNAMSGQKGSFELVD
jgi:beta-glucosidase